MMKEDERNDDILCLIDICFNCKELTLDMNREMLDDKPFYEYKGNNYCDYCYNNMMNSVT